MSTETINNPPSNKRIVVTKNGPYIVQGDIPLVIKTQVVSEYGEPLTWQKEADISVNPGEYLLCRCGQSSNKPFCTGAHRKVGFDGTETADTGSTETRARKYPNATRIIIKKDDLLCIESGFCGLRDAGMKQLAAATADSRIRSLVIAMVERCPSGSLTYQFEEDGPINEPDLPQQIAVTTEITSDGPIAGPIWVSGGIPVERSDGKPIETRNRLTLCNCGHSNNKPLCDGTHRVRAERDARQRRNASQ
jgi:CDGSH-type Zn-finger protein